MLSGLAVASGGALAMFDRLSQNSTIRGFPVPWGHLLLVSIVAGALVSLAGAATRTLTGVKVERAGLVGLVLCGAVYGSWALGQHGASGFTFAMILFFLAGGALWRVLRIRHDLRAGDVA
ncbi:hypothetical protein GCM10027184_10360 [Saccharothrix stipae]